MHRISFFSIFIFDLLLPKFLPQHSLTSENRMSELCLTGILDCLNFSSYCVFLDKFLGSPPCFFLLFLKISLGILCNLSSVIKTEFIKYNLPFQSHLETRRASSPHFVISCLFYHPWFEILKAKILGSLDLPTAVQFLTFHMNNNLKNP